MLLNHSTDFATFDPKSGITKVTPALQMPPLRAAEQITALATNSLIETSSGWQQAGKIRAGDLARDGCKGPVDLRLKDEAIFNHVHHMCLAIPVAQQPCAGRNPTTVTRDGLVS